MEGTTVLKEFKEFVMRGNLVEIAVGLTLATAFTALVASFTQNILMQIVAAIGGQPNFDDLTIKIGDGRIRYGAFINAIITFLIIAFVLFLVIKAYNQVLAASKRDGKKEEVTEPGEDVILLREIRDSLRARNL
jgi:large conductance mechanosensitive channel